MNKRLSILLLFFVACNSNIKKTSEGSFYYYEPLKWQILIPETWEVMSDVERKQMMFKANSYYQEDNLQKQYGQKNIIMGLKKPNDKVTAMYAFTRSYRLGDSPPELKSILIQQYHSYSSGAYSSDTSLSIENINGYQFEKAVLNVHYEGKPYFSYITYSTELRDTLTFGVSIISNNQNDSLMLRNNFVESLETL